MSKKPVPKKKKSHHNSSHNHTREKALKIEKTALSEEESGTYKCQHVICSKFGREHWFSTQTYRKNHHDLPHGCILEGKECQVCRETKNYLKEEDVVNKSRCQHSSCYVYLKKSGRASHEKLKHFNCSPKCLACKKRKEFLEHFSTKFSEDPKKKKSNGIDSDDGLEDSDYLDENHLMVDDNDNDSDSENDNDDAEYIDSDQESSQEDSENGEAEEEMAEDLMEDENLMDNDDEVIDRMEKIDQINSTANEPELTLPPPQFIPHKSFSQQETIDVTFSPEEEQPLQQQHEKKKKKGQQYRFKDNNYYEIYQQKHHQKNGSDKQQIYEDVPHQQIEKDNRYTLEHRIIMMSFQNIEDEKPSDYDLVVNKRIVSRLSTPAIPSKPDTEQRKEKSSENNPTTKVKPSSPKFTFNDDSFTAQVWRWTFDKENPFPFTKREPQKFPGTYDDFEEEITVTTNLFTRKRNEIPIQIDDSDDASDDSDSEEEEADSNSEEESDTDERDGSFYYCRHQHCKRGKGRRPMGFINERDRNAHERRAFHRDCNPSKCTYKHKVKTIGRFKCPNCTFNCWAEKKYTKHISFNCTN